MTILSKSALGYLRQVTGPFNGRPLGVLAFRLKEYPDTIATYSISITASTIGIVQGSNSFNVTFVDKTTRQVASELSNSPYPIEVKPLADVGLLKVAELIASGVDIPLGFDREDISNDGKSVIVRCFRFAVSYNKISALGVSAPYFEGPQLPWWVRITNGNFSQIYKGIIYHFSLPEYSRQVWSTNYGRPFMDVEGEPAQFIGTSIIKLARSPVLYKNKNIVLVSTGADKPYPSSIIKDVDTINGLIYLQDGVVLPKDIIVYYSYLENSLLYKDIDLNGHFSHNPYILDKYVLFYVLPSKSSSGKERNKCVYHSIGTSIDDAIYKIQIPDSIEPLTILGAVNIKPVTDTADISITDTRSFGGGLNTNEYGITAEKKYKESQYFFDIGRKEGIPYPGSASIVVDLPAHLKETLSIFEIRERTQRWVAAGVYPIVRFQDAEYYDQFSPNDYNADISLAPYSFATGNTGLSEYAFGPTGQAAYFINNDLNIGSGIYYSGYASGHDANAEISNDIIKLSPGETYKLSYLKGSADAIFSYEEKSFNGQWTRVTKRNTVSIPTGQLSSHSLVFDSRYGYKEIRNLTGFAPYVPSSSFKLDLATAFAKINEHTDSLFSNGVQTGQVYDVLTATITGCDTNTIGVRPLLYPLYTNYNAYSNLNLYSGHALLSGDSRTFYLNTTGNTFPTINYTGTYSGTYDAFRDIEAYAKFTRWKINESLRINTGAVPINNPFVTWIAPNPDNSAAYAHSGAIALFNAIDDLSPFSGNGNIGSDIISPFYNPATNQMIPLWTGSISEVDINLNNLKHSTDYIRAASSIYAAHIAPPDNQTTGNIDTDLIFNVRNVALTGFGYPITFFSNYFTASISGQTLEMTWLSTYNRIASYGARLIDNLCDSFDSLYYGNDCWAGWSGYGSKTTPYYHVIYNPTAALLQDTNWTRVIAWPDLTSATAANTMPKIISGICDIQDTMMPYIKAQSYYGGIIEPGYVTAVKNFLWYPTHKASNHHLFSGNAIDAQPYVDTFEAGMSNILKSSLNEDGILIEGGGFKYQQAPFSGSVPSELFDACSRAVVYYDLIDDELQSRKWLSIAQGLFYTTEALYAQSGGYPYNVVLDTIAAGDPGSVPLNGYAKLFNVFDVPFTSDEVTNITGSITRVY